MMNFRPAVGCSLLLNALASVVLAAPSTWDSRLTDLGICYFEASVPAGTYYWKLVSGVYQDPNESGGNHNIYFKCLNGSGQPIENQLCWAGWGNTGSAVPCPTIPNPMDGTASQLTKGSIDGYWANFGMAGGWCPFWPEGPHGGYGAWVDGLSDQVWGMGMPCNLHVNYLYIWQWTQAGPPPPATISRSPAILSHTITQGQSPSDDTFTVWNSGGSTLNYSITDDAAWLSENPSSGNATTETDTITVHYTAGALAVGSHSATITISDPNSTNKTQTIAVSLVVQPPVIPGDFNGDGDVDQDDFGRFQVCFSGSGYEQPDPKCEKAKMDTDNDVDQVDFGLFEQCLTGPNVQGSPTCAQGG